MDIQKKKTAASRPKREGIREHDLTGARHRGRRGDPRGRPDVARTAVLLSAQALRGRVRRRAVAEMRVIGEAHFQRRFLFFNFNIRGAAPVYPIKFNINILSAGTTTPTQDQEASKRTPTPTPLNASRSLFYIHT